MTLSVARLVENAPIPPGFAETVRVEVASIDDFPTITEYRDRLSAVESYLARKSDDCAEVRRAQRFVEVRIGELLGPVEQGQRTNPGLSLASDSGIALTPNERHAFRLMAEHVDLVESSVDSGKDSRSEVMRQIRAHQREQTPVEADFLATDRLDVRHGDFRDALSDLEDGSVDLIVTDPPYPKDDLPLYGDLAKHAARLLGPRGLLFVWTGQIFLPEVIALLSEHLTYGWTFCLDMPGAGSRILGRHIIQSWKPVLAFSTGTWPSGEWADDKLVSPSREKARYEWEQNAAPAQRLIERFCPPNGLVVDPFVGVGSFGVAALAAERRFVGVELDDGRYSTACERLS